MNGTALVRRPSSRLAEGIVTHIGRTPVDVELARSQHAAYADALAATGWAIRPAPAADDCPDSVFVEDAVVDALAGFLRGSHGRGKLLVLAQESTPVYCRFYSKGDIDGGRVAEWHLRGLDLEGCRAMLGRATIDPEALRRVYLLTKGCPLYLRAIREGDEETLRAYSRFTKAEIRLLIYSGGLAR